MILKDYWDATLISNDWVNLNARFYSKLGELLPFILNHAQKKVKIVCIQIGLILWIPALPLAESLTYPYTIVTSTVDLFMIKVQFVGVYLENGRGMGVEWWSGVSIQIWENKGVSLEVKGSIYPNLYLAKYTVFGVVRWQSSGRTISKQGIQGTTGNVKSDDRRLISASLSTRELSCCLLFHFCLVPALKLLYNNVIRLNCS